MKQIVAEKEAVQIGNRAFTALLEEVYASPKPGLVDLYSNGAHQDMNVRTFERSAAILAPSSWKWRCRDWSITLRRKRFL